MRAQRQKVYFTGHCNEYATLLSKHDDLCVLESEFIWQDYQNSFHIDDGKVQKTVELGSRMLVSCSLDDDDSTVWYAGKNVSIGKKHPKTRIKHTI